MKNMVYIDDDYINLNTDFYELTEHLKEGFAGSTVMVPLRHYHEFPNPSSEENTALLLMPAWHAGNDAGVKLVTVNPHNKENNLPSIQGVYVYLNAGTGQAEAILSAAALTAKRTAAASALASSFLSRKDASSLLMIGTGALSANLIKAHAAIRPIKKVFVWGRNVDKALRICSYLSDEPYRVEAVSTIEEVVEKVDIISCATLSEQPLVKGQYLRPGQHLDFVGSYRRHTREADSKSIARSSLFVDSFEGALKEAGDLIIPMEEGLIKKEDLQADLFELCRDEKPGRLNNQEITLFKSVGHALEDLVAARYYFEKYR